MHLCCYISGNFLYIVIKGSCQITALSVSGEDVNVATVNSGAIIGEIALLESTIRTASITTLEDCLFLKLTSDKFNTFLTIAPELKHSIEYMMLFRKQSFIEKIPLFSKLSDSGKPWSKLALMGELFQVFR